MTPADRSQICYFVCAYLQARPAVDGEVDFAIPSGAFGNTCAATFAKAMGVPIRHIIPSANENDIVFRTLTYGDYSLKAEDYHLVEFNPSPHGLD